jgi:hypothetical protein
MIIIVLWGPHLLRRPCICICDKSKMTEILLKVELKHQKSNQIKSGQVYKGNRRKITEGISQVGYSFYSYHKYICMVALGGVDPITQ